jgi:hypothetical protein
MPDGGHRDQRTPPSAYLHAPLAQARPPDAGAHRRGRGGPGARAGDHGALAGRPPPVACGGQDRACPCGEGEATPASSALSRSGASRRRAPSAPRHPGLDSGSRCVRAARTREEAGPRIKSGVTRKGGACRGEAAPDRVRGRLVGPVSLLGTSCPPAALGRLALSQLGACAPRLSRTAAGCPTAAPAPAPASARSAAGRRTGWRDRAAPSRPRDGNI